MSRQALMRALAVVVIALPCALVPIVLHGRTSMQLQTVRATQSRFAPDATAPQCGELAANLNLEARLEAAGWYAVAAGPRGKPCWVSGKDAIERRTRSFGLETLLVAKAAEGGAAVLKMAADLLPAPDAQVPSGSLEPGQDVEILDSKGELVKVRTDKGVAGWLAKKALHDATQAVVKTSTSILTDIAEGKHLATITPGDLVTVLRATKDFVKLKAEDGTVGWVAAKAVAEVHEFAPVPAHLQIPSPAPVKQDAPPAKQDTQIKATTSTEGDLTVQMWIQKPDGTVIGEGAGLKEGDEYEVHATCSQDCFLRVTGETPETHTLCQYSPIHVKGYDVSPLIKAGEDAWPKLLPAGAHYKVFPPVMTEDIVRVEAIPARGGTPFHYIEGKGNAPGCTPTSTTASKTRSVGIVFGSPVEDAAAASSTSVPAVALQRSFFTNPLESVFTAIADGETLPAEAGTRSLAAPASGPTINVLSPRASSSVGSPVEIRAMFLPRSSDAPIDPESFQARVTTKTGAKDVTPLFRKFVTESGMNVRGAKFAKGSYHLELTVKDTAGRATTTSTEFNVR